MIAPDFDDPPRGARCCSPVPGSQPAMEPVIPPSLAHVNRIYIEQLGGGQTSDQMRDMIIAALQNSKLFVITENQERADAMSARIVGRQDFHRRT